MSTDSELDLISTGTEPYLMSTALKRNLNSIDSELHILSAAPNSYVMRTGNGPLGK